MRVAVIGGGISGLTTAYRLQKQGVEVTVLERDSEAGGQARSSKHDGFVLDWGPGGFLANAPLTIALAEELGLGSQLRPAADAAKTRFLFSRGKIRALPDNPKSFLSTDLIGPLDKLRALLELSVPPLEPGKDESVYDFASRRFGPGLARAFILPMVLGITSGDARATSINSLFPRMRLMEQTYGGVFKAMFATMRGKRKSTGSPTGSRLTNFPDGINTLPAALAQALGPSLRAGVTVTAVARAGKGYRVSTSNGETIEADAVVLASPAHVTANLVEGLNPALASELRDIKHASVRVLGLAYRREDVPANLDGFGFLTPRGEKVKLLGCLYTSTLFPEHSRPGHAYFRVISGGVFDPDFVNASDEEALHSTRQDLKVSLGITAEPVMVQQVRWPNAIPQYDLDHQPRLKRIDAQVATLPGLFLTGHAYRGVGLNECVKHSTAVAAQVAEYAKYQAENTPVSAA